MKQWRRIVLAGLMFAGSALTSAAGGAGPDPPPLAPPPRIPVAELFRRLGSEDFRERDAATAALKLVPEARHLLLHAHRTSESPEVRERVASILAVLKRQDAEKRLARLPEYAKHRQLDRLVETLVAYREFVTSEHDKHVRAFVKDILDTATGSEDCPWIKDIPQFGMEREGRSVLIARSADSGLFRNGAVISEKLDSGSAGVVFSVVLCNGDVDASKMTRAVVITTGSVRLGDSRRGLDTGSIDSSAIVCAGNVVAWDGGNVLVVTAGQIGSFSGVGSINRSGGNVVRQQDKEFFRTWNLYSASEVGVELGSAFGVVWVRAVTPHSHCAKAGINPGDLLSSINGTSVGSLRAANRLLCRATVSSDKADLTVVRGDRVITAKVSLPE